MRINGQAPYNTLICDLDGTLVDSAPDLEGALITLLTQEGRRELSLIQVKSMIGDGVAKLVERGFTATGGCPESPNFEMLVARFLEIYNARLVVETRPYPGAFETLTRLKEAGWRLVVCTNKPEAPSREILESLELAPLFEAVAGGDSYSFRKPDPRHLLSLLDSVQISPGTAVMFGDGPADIAAARAAKVPSILATFGYGGTAAKELSPDQDISTFASLPEALERIAADG